MTRTKNEVANARNFAIDGFSVIMATEASRGSKIKSAVSKKSNQRVYENAITKITPITITKM